jgi:AraC family transcriptional regulator
LQTPPDAVDKGGALVSILQVMTPGNRSFSSSPRTMHPLSWRDWERPAQSKASAPRTIRGAIIQRWEGSAPQMDQPPLDHHYIVVHLGGDKRITRSRRTESIVRDVPTRAISTIAAGSSYRWMTEGPIAFGHIYLEPNFFAQTIGEQFDCDPARIELHEDFGQVDPLLGHLCDALVRAADGDDVSLMEQEMQLEAALHRLYERQSAQAAKGQRMLISPASVSRVREFIYAHLQQQITLDQLADLSGYSRFHFARGFRAATGLPPYAYILRARIALACRLLDDARLPVQAIASETGFASHPQFTNRFRQLTGISPSAYRRIMR